MKNTIKILLSLCIAVTLILTSVQPFTTTSTLNNTDAQARGLGWLKPKPKPKPKPKTPKKKTAQQLYNNAKKKGIKVKGRNDIQKSTKTKKNLPITGKKYSSKDLVDSKGIKQRRYYDGNGKASMDIDYRHSVGKKQNVKFPHRHYWKNGKRSGH